ncbi:MAG: hypothetical protein H6708_21360 [Kofleriaceae bacterium]|nr:hypothetical protein [Kofleriaceae bacterium]
MRTRDAMVVVTLAAGVVVATPPRADACGPDFEIELLSRRDDAMFELQEGIFSIEAGQLVAPPGRRYKVAVGDDPYGVRDLGDPEETARYERGAEAFARGDLAAAERAFASVLALPPAQRLHRSTWAAYMLGRLRDGDAAIAAYRQVRALVDLGFLDERALAASSLGQEARLELARGRVGAAIGLYAEQAAHGHADGWISLLAIARQGIRDGQEAELLATSVGQRLVAAYLDTRAHELTAEQRDRLWRELAALDAVAGADHLAAAAYRDGRWALAGQLAGRDPDRALSRWVRAKLALRAGDPATAEVLLGQVATTLDADAARCAADDPDRAPWEDAPEPRFDDGLRDRVAGERAILALRGDRPVDAMAEIWAARGSYPTDVMHVAERVLTVDELRAFVDGRADADDVLDDRDGDGYAYARAWTRSLRDVLARRLMRVGRFTEALPYFDADNRTDAALLASALTRAAPDGGHRDPIERAQALYEASRMARRHGMELLGTEHAPDWAAYDGQFDLGEYGIDGGWPRDEPSPWVSRGERGRIDGNAPTYRQRYHYRYLASALAEQAADLLPPRSQAFAAVLCHATAYVLSTDRDRVDELWLHYTRDGATVDFASHFGQDCPEPEFERARHMPRPAPRRSRHPRRDALLRWTWPGVAAATALGIALVAGALWRRRRRRLTVVAP